MTQDKLSKDVEEKLKAFRALVDDVSLRAADLSRGDMHQLGASYNKVLLAHQTLLVEVERLRAPATQLNHDPIKDEKKLYTLAEFIDIAKHEIDLYNFEFNDQNDFHRQSHTWNEWFTSFHQYMSW